MAKNVSAGRPKIFQIGQSYIMTVIKSTENNFYCLFTFDEKSKINNQLVKIIKVKFFSIILSVEVVFCRF